MEPGNEATKSIQSTYGAGLSPDDAMGVEAMEGLQKTRGSFGFAAKSAIMGAGMGAQAAQGAMNPLSAFLQGAAAGLQAPAIIYEQKRKQVQSTLDAMPFGVRFPEIVKDPAYQMLAGIPSGIVLPFMAKFAEDTNRITKESEARIAEKKLEYSTEYVQEGKDAENAAKMLQEADPENKPRTPGSLVGMRRQDLDDLLKMKSGLGGSATIGSMAADRAFAREYAEYLGGGGYSDTQNQIKSLESARDDLKSGGEYTGFFTNMFSGAVVNPKALAMQEQIESSVQRTLKKTLGGQFTEREGIMFLRRGFNPKLSEKENIKKLTRMIDQLKIMDIAKRESIEYFEQNGTLQGYKGRYFTVKDGQIIPNELPGAEKVSGGLTPDEEKELRELEKKGKK